MKKLFIFAGEASGDLHGSQILNTLKPTLPHLEIKGVGGPRMLAAGMPSELPIEIFQVMGFKDVLCALPRLLKAFYTVLNTILTWNPDTVLLIDHPGFNLRLAKKLRKKGFKGKICQYICPTIWAWKKERKHLMEENLDLLLTILPFEPLLFNQKKLPTYYVGNPLIHEKEHHTPQPLCIPKDKKLISLFPGSRKKELERNLPTQLDCALQLQQHHKDLLFALSLGHKEALDYADKLIDKHYKKLRPYLFYTDRTYDLMHTTYAAIATSGTVTLELALHSVPTVITYKLPQLDALIAKYIFKINLPYYSLVNILAQKTLFAEHIGTHLCKDTLFTSLSPLIEHKELYNQCQKELIKIKHLLGDKKAHTEVAHHLCTSL